jgi:site-specific recombinase XerD
MMSNSCPQDDKYSIDNVFKGMSVRPEEGSLFRQFLSSHDLSPHTVRALVFDIRKFVRYFFQVNNEPFDNRRVTTADLVGFKRYLRENCQQEVSTVNRALVSIRRYLDWLVAQGHLAVNPAKVVKEYRHQPIVPKGLDRSQVRKLLREVELRKDIRANAIFSILLYSGCRVSDLVSLELHDLIINERSGTVIFRNGKGNKQRQCPLPLPARKAVQDYLEIRPPVQSANLFVGERGPLSDKGVRALCNKYSAICGVKIYPHLLRHTMAHAFLRDTNNDIVSLSQILGHENLNTTARYTQRTSEQLGDTAEKLSY